MTAKDELEGLAEDVREAIGALYMDGRLDLPKLDAVVAELIRLARENAELRESVRKANSQAERFERECYLHGDRAERAESELAALRKRIADAPVISVSRHPISGVMRAVVSDPNLDGKRVRLLLDDAEVG